MLFEIGKRLTVKQNIRIDEVVHPLTGDLRLQRDVPAHGKLHSVGIQISKKEVVQLS